MNFRLYSGSLLCFFANTLASYGQANRPTSALYAALPLELTNYVGFRVGYSQYQMRGSEVASRTTPFTYQSATGSVTVQDAKRPVHWFTAGLVYRQRLIKLLSFQTELTYVRQGGKFTATPIPRFVHNDTDYTIDYVQIPGLLNLQAFRVGPLTLQVEGGMTLNVVAKPMRLEASRINTANAFTSPRMLVATVMGAELAWHHGESQYLLSMRYTHDLAACY